MENNIFIGSLTPLLNFCISNIYTEVSLTEKESKIYTLHGLVISSKFYIKESISLKSYDLLLNLLTNF